MATSGSYTYSVTRDTLILSAFRVIGVFNDDSAPPATDLSNAVQALNLMLKEMIAEGYPLWCVSDVVIPLTTSTTYTLGPTGSVVGFRPLRVIYGRLRYPTTNLDVPLIQLSRQEYNVLGNKLSPGVPNSYYYDPQTYNGVLSLYLTPQSILSGDNVTLTCQRPLQDMLNSTDDFDFPIEWLNSIKYGLATELAMEYDIAPQKLQLIAQKWDVSKRKLFDWSVEEAGTFFTPNTLAGGFRRGRA